MTALVWFIVWFGMGAAAIGVVSMWRPELKGMVSENTPGYGITRRGASVFIYAMLAVLWPVVLYAAVKRHRRDEREAELIAAEPLVGASKEEVEEELDRFKPVEQ